MLSALTIHFNKRWNSGCYKMYSYRTLIPICRQMFLSHNTLCPLFISLWKEMLSPSLYFTSLHYISYICENCSTFLLGGFLGPSERFAYWRPASFIIQGKVWWLIFFLNVIYILKTNKPKKLVQVDALDSSL